MVNVVNKELHFDKGLKKKIEFICEFSHTVSSLVAFIILLYG